MFEGENILDFTEKFKTDKDCLFYLANIKWANGYVCPKCQHKKYTVRKSNLARECNRCHRIDSPTANTLFHKVKFGIRKSFLIIFEMSASTKGLSSSQVAKRYGVSRKTSWAFMHKVRKAMESSTAYPIDGKVQVDEFVFGGKETLKQGRSTDSKKKKIVGAVALSSEGKVSRAYFRKIENYSSESLRTIFDRHISKEAVVYTDKWTGYKPLKKEYTIIDRYSDKGNSMKQMHTIIHQLKSWLRSTYSWVHENHIEKYLDEYSFRINRSIFKQTIFNKLINRMMNHKPFTFQMITAST